MLNLTDLDPSLLGLDAAKVLAINEISSRVKEIWPSLRRFYFFTPFMVAAFLCLTMEQNLESILGCTIKYGAFATATWNFQKKVIGGK